MRRKTLAVGVAQMPETADLGRNLREIARFVELARRAGVALLVFPECALTGYGPAFHKSSAAFDPDAIEAASRKCAAWRGSRAWRWSSARTCRSTGAGRTARCSSGPTAASRRATTRRTSTGWTRNIYLAGRAAPAVKAACGAAIGMRDLLRPAVPRSLPVAGAAAAPS